MNMKKNVFLIRSSQYDSNRLEIQIKKFEKYKIDYYIIEENYSNLSIRTYFKSPNHLVVGPDYLDDNKLSNFPKVGWQCGDYVAYIGHTFFPDYDFYWVVDSDLYLNLNLNEFVNYTNRMDYDCLALDYSMANDKWHWYKTLSDKYKYIYKMLYCLVRLSNSSVVFLKEQRANYNPKIEGDDYHLFANDEVFTGTVLTNGGFSFEKMQTVLPQYFSNNLFSLNRFFHVSELDKEYSKDQIIHPVCDSKSLKIKINDLVKKKALGDMVDRTYRLFCNFEEEACRSITNVSLLEIYKEYYNSKKIVNLKNIAEELGSKNLQNVKKCWFWKPTVYVIDFSLKDIIFGVDITADGSVFIVARNDKSKDFFGKIFGKRANKFCLIKNIDYINKDLDIVLRKSHTENILNFIFWIFAIIEIN